MGGCTWTAHALFDRAGNNPMCHYRALEMEKEGLRERLVKVKDAHGLPFDHGEFALIVEPIPTAEARERDRILVHG